MSHRIRKMLSQCPVISQRKDQLPIFLLRGGTQLFVKTLSAKTQVLAMDDADAVLTMKHGIEEKGYIPVEYQRFVSGRQELRNERQLAAPAA